MSKAVEKLCILVSPKGNQNKLEKLNFNYVPQLEKKFFEYMQKSSFFSLYLETYLQPIDKSNQSKWHLLLKSVNKLNISALKSPFINYLNHSSEWNFNDMLTSSNKIANCLTRAGSSFQIQINILTPLYLHQEEAAFFPEHRIFLRQLAGRYENIQNQTVSVEVLNSIIQKSNTVSYYCKSLSVPRIMDKKFIMGNFSIKFWELQKEEKDLLSRLFGWAEKFSLNDAGIYWEKNQLSKPNLYSGLGFCEFELKNKKDKSL